MSDHHEEKGEAAKLAHHLSLLKAEYNKLQAAHLQLQQQMLRTQATIGKNSNNFINKLLQFVSQLYNSEHMSDISIKMTHKTCPAHQFVLNARGDNWSSGKNANDPQRELNWTDLNPDVGEALLCWVYTDSLKVPETFSREDFIVQMLLAAGKFKLAELLNCCEQLLLPMVDVSNCVKLYMAAEETAAEDLRKYCASIISNRWDDLRKEDFEPLSSQLLYRLLEEHTTHPLHAAVRLDREDVVFLDIVKYTQQLPTRLNAVDSKGDLALDIALRMKSDAIASSLVQHGASVDSADLHGQRLIHKAIARCDLFSCKFLLEHGAVPFSVIPETNWTVLHLLAKSSPNGKTWSWENIEEIGNLVLQKGADPNAASTDGSTALHYAVINNSQAVLKVLLANSRTDCDRQDHRGHVPLWYALQQYEKSGGSDSTVVDALVSRGASCNVVSSVTGDSLLHQVARESMEKSAFFLVKHGAQVNTLNRSGESPLHVAAQSSLAALVTLLLENGGNPNTQTMPQTTTLKSANTAEANPFDEDETADADDDLDSSGLETPLHLAVKGGSEAVVAAFVNYSSAASAKGGKAVDFNLRNCRGETPLCAALKKGCLAIGQLLLRGGASVNALSPHEGRNLLHYFIINRDEKAALFLLDNSAEVNVPTANQESPLLLCIRNGLSSVLESLCRRGASMEEVFQDTNGEQSCPLWLALSSNEEDLASVLVRYGVDTDHWNRGPEGCLQTLLHKAIDENNQSAACFLIRSGCDVNSPRRPGPNGEGGEECRDLATPLHMCCTWGLVSIVTALLEHGADVNARDAENKTPLHTAIEQHQDEAVQLLLQHPSIDLYCLDKGGRSPFAAALAFKNIKAARSVLARDPSVAEQYDNKGRTLVHSIVLRGDLEGLLFLLSVHVNVNCQTADATKLTPLHLAVQTGKDEMILRNLIVAGAILDERGPRQQTALHMAAEREDGAAFTAILLDAGADWNATDDAGNTALHTAARLCHVQVSRTLLTQSQIDAESRNMRGQNPLHLAAMSGREAAAALLALFLECMPQYPVNAPDIDGSTPLLLAYMKGNAPFCKALVRAGACLAATNKNGVSIFNYQLATKQLLFRLLEQLSQEPPWAEHDFCMECGSKFGITTRKHHCRHCGRILCNKCSDQVIPILKFNLNKPVRVCGLCWQVMSASTPSP